MADLFISQERLDFWVSQGKFAIAGDVLKLLEINREFDLQPAVRFLTSVTGEDPGGLLGKVKTEEALAMMGADHMDNSVIVDEAAYTVQQGFLGKLS